MNPNETHPYKIVSTRRIKLRTVYSEMYLNYV